MRRNLCWAAVGVVVGVVLSLAAAYALGPRGSQTFMNLYNGATWTDHHLLWHRWRTERLAGEHTEWARKHRTSGRTYWPVFVCSFQREWAWGCVAGDGAARDIAAEIYALPIADKEKVELLHAFHRDIDDLAEGLDANDRYMALYRKWDQRMQDAR